MCDQIWVRIILIRKYNSHGNVAIGCHLSAHTIDYQLSDHSIIHYLGVYWHHKQDSSASGVGPEHGLACWAVPSIARLRRLEGTLAPDFVPFVCRTLHE